MFSFDGQENFWVHFDPVLLVKLLQASSIKFLKAAQFFKYCRKSR